MVLPFATKAMTDACRQAMMEALEEYWSDPKNRQAKSEAIPFNPKEKTHTRNQWRKSGLLRQPYQCAISVENNMKVKVLIIYSIWRIVIIILYCSPQ